MSARSGDRLVSPHLPSQNQIALLAPVNLKESISETRAEVRMKDEGITDTQSDQIKKIWVFVHLYFRKGVSWSIRCSNPNLCLQGISMLDVHPYAFTSRNDSHIIPIMIPYVPFKLNYRGALSFGTSNTLMRKRRCFNESLSNTKHQCPPL